MVAEDCEAVKELPQLIRTVLLKECQRNDPFLAAKDIAALGCYTKVKSFKQLVHSNTIVGYPSSPLYLEIAAVLQHWLRCRHWLVADLPTMFMLDENDYPSFRLGTCRKVESYLEGYLMLYSHWCMEERLERVRTVLQMFGRRGLLDLLGVRKTYGSIDRWPPSPELLMKTLNSRHSTDSPSTLSVGARALSKHYHRDCTSEFWGSLIGTESEKNATAAQLVRSIIEQAVWINFHYLPSQLTTIEVRQADGYGVRWLADGSDFRGFLEPMMVGGHELGWKH